jgi:hypothetical protein
MNQELRYLRMDVIKKTTSISMKWSHDEWNVMFLYLFCFDFDGSRFGFFGFGDV